MNQRSIRFVSVILLLLAGVAGPVQAQAPDRDVQLAAARELIRMGREEVIKEEMPFTPGQAEKFWPLYKQYREELAVVQDDYIALLVDYVGDYYDYNLTDDDAEKIIDDYFDIQSNLLKIRKRYVRRFQKILSASNVMRLYQLENKIEAEVNAALALTLPLMEPE